MSVWPPTWTNQVQHLFVFFEKFRYSTWFKNDDVAPVNCFYFINHLIVFCKNSKYIVYVRKFCNSHIHNYISMSYNVRSTHYYLVFLLLRTTRQMYVIELFRISILTNYLHKLFSATRLHLEFSFFSSLSYCTFRENSSHLLHTTSIQRVWPKKRLLPKYVYFYQVFFCYEAGRAP